MLSTEIQPTTIHSPTTQVAITQLSTSNKNASPAPTSSVTPPFPSDKTLHQQFVELGKQRNRLTYQLLALIPEIFQQKIYQKMGYTTIYEYAGRLAGLSKFVVQKVLRTDKNLEDKPFLKEAVKTQGIHKVSLIAKLATPETEKAWADKVANMSKASLFTLAKEVRGKNRNGHDGELGIFSKCAAAEEKVMVELSGEALFLFLKLKKKLAENMTNKDALREILRKLCDHEFSKVSEAFQKCSRDNYCQKKENIAKQHNLRQPKGPNVSRQASARQKRAASNNGKCAYPNCHRPAEVFHHRDRFSKSKNHESIIPLCHEHHQFMHNGLIKNEKDEPKNWQIKVEKTNLNNIDEKFRRCRQEALSR